MASSAAKRMADRADYGYVHRCDTLWSPGEAPYPQLTPQLAGWVARSSAKAVMLWEVEYGDRGFAESVCEAIALAARFAVDGYLDGEWRQFSCFSVAQLADAAGWDENRARRALGACGLDVPRRLSPKISSFCMELAQRGAAPFLAQIKAGKRGQGTTYRFVGIELWPGPRGDRPREGAGENTCGANGRTGQREEADPASPGPAAFGGTGDMPAPPPLPSPRADLPPSPSTSASPATGGLAEPGEEPPLESYADLAAWDGPGVDGERWSYEGQEGMAVVPVPAEDVPVDPDSVEAPDALAGREGAESGVEGAYLEFKGCFQCAPGTREGETRQRFMDRVAAGYLPEDIVAGARAYLTSPSVPPDKRWWYPLKWLEDDDAFRAFVHRAPERPLSEMSAHERAQKAKFTHNVDTCGYAGGVWTARESSGNPVVVNCPGDCTREEARLAFERQLEQGR